MKTSEKGLALIKKYEGLQLVAYRCPSGIPTIGYGHTKGVKLGQSITYEQACLLFSNDITIYELAVEALVDVPLTQHQFDALVSFTFNLGVGSLSRSTLLVKLNQKNYRGAADEFLRWVYGGGKRLPGLVKRRQEERSLFLL